MDSAIQTSISPNQSFNMNNQALDTDGESEFQALMSAPSSLQSQSASAGSQTLTTAAVRETSASPASISSSASKYAKAFGGADGFGGDGHDRSKLQAAGLSYDSNGSTSIQDVLNAAGNRNQFHISQDGQEQTQRVFALAEAEGMTQDGYLSAGELTQLKNIIQNPSLGSTAESRTLASAIASDAARSNTWTGSAETGGSASAPTAASEASEAPQGSESAEAASGAMGAGAFNFKDWLMTMLGLNLEQMAQQWKTQEGRAEITDSVKTRLEDTGMDSASVDSTMAEFSGLMDGGDVEGAVALIEGAVNTATL